MTTPQRALPAEPEERGSLRIAPVVVRKVAQHAADQVPGTTAVQRTLAGLGIGSQGATVRVSGTGNDVDLAVDLALHYPAPVREVVGRVRAEVVDQVQRITEFRVRGVDVTVSALLPDIKPRVE